ncbi:MAG: hypothetical protein QOI88_1743 [Gammaproteobacteria bacterium]|jgi:hypothetical protein|nr:hypothetical protein [Gammaproteobacteria bacterium]
MAMSVRLDPALEIRVEQESRRLGITKSEFVKDALARVLGLTNPADLLGKVRSGKPMGNREASGNVSARVKAKFRAKTASTRRCRTRMTASNPPGLVHVPKGNGRALPDVAESTIS